MPTIATNRKAYHDYEIIDKLEVGIQLTGPEVKSVKAGQVQLGDSYARISDDLQATLLNAYIAPYKEAPDQELDAYRTRKLLLHRQEIVELQSRVKKDNLTLVPLNVHTSRKGYVKIELGLVRGKKMFEKRQKEQERQVKKDIAQNLKKYK